MLFSAFHSLAVFTKNEFLAWAEVRPTSGISRHLSLFLMNLSIGDLEYIKSRYFLGFIFLPGLRLSDLDLVTLTLGQLQHPINTYHVHKYHQYPIIGSLYIVETCLYKLQI